MFMRYRGGGAGHAAVRGAVDEFLLDRDAIDIEYHEKREAELHGMQHEAQQGEGDAQEMQDDEDKAGWEDDLEDMDEDEHGDYGYRRHGNPAEDPPSDESDEDWSEDDDFGRLW